MSVGMDQIRDLLWPGVRAIAAKYPDQWEWDLSIDDGKMIIGIVDKYTRKELSATLFSHEEIDDNVYKRPFVFVLRLTAMANAFKALSEQSP
jgi:hypothetical protein